MSVIELGMLPLSEYARKMRVTYLTAWRWFKKGLLDGSKQDENGVRVPELLVPENIERAEEVITLAEYARRVGEPYFRVKASFLDGEIPSSYRNPGGTMHVLIFSEEKK
ncbi:MAG: hypothetical protein ACTSUO_02745 [Candidatus Thorarchaeota archaeon]